ncbi:MULTISPECIES: rhamnulokinase [Enterobacteriaceae]|uniref:rhamnulokinase n=1 Tax=Enterobacteriaceae TaxID=543 RepID=UPI000272A2A1|nr:rhamnulokinase [Enterobacter sp. Ag1]EJF31114.1 rhamnulokinase [Enterobacter sp. Ag1]
MTFRHSVAVDLGASSGRVMLAGYDQTARQISLREIHRFTNSLIRIDGHDCWDLDSLEAEIRLGLQKACDEGVRIDSIGIDTWGVDFVLLDENGRRVGLPVSYRDSRTDGVMARAISELGREVIYRRSGIQFLPFNTLYQLRALVEQHPDWVKRTARALLIPDYFSFRLTGVMNWEYTNATTTQMINIQTDSWDSQLLAWAGVPERWFGTPTHPGVMSGEWECREGNNIPVVSVATHDTASAVIAAPLVGENAAYLSSGTWSLMGFESKTPCVSEAALAANITNEGGAEGRYRVLKNIMGLWLLQRVSRESAGMDIPDLIALAQHLPGCRFTINPNDDRFINPANMSLEIQAACREANQPVPESDAELARCIFDSLALLYAEVLRELEALRGEPFGCLHIVGGGSQNHFLNQLCADACGIPVVAGPVEASTLGNIGCQLMALDVIPDVDAFRHLVRQNSNLISFMPNPDSDIRRYVGQLRQNIQTRKELYA